VDIARIAQAPAPITPDPEDHERLLAAAKDALAWFERFDAHARRP
jgi:hypothetical protein